MSKTPRCCLTTKDFSILEVLLERRINKDEAFLRLLRQKLSTATVVFWDDLDRQVATINSRIDFTIDGQHADDRLLVHGGEQAYPRLALPITTLRGLALLGLTIGETIVAERSDGGTETLRLDRISHQPEADRKDRLRRQTTSDARPEQRSSVVALVRRKPLPATPSAGPDDDDPGPRAA